MLSRDEQTFMTQRQMSPLSDRICGRRSVARSFEKRFASKTQQKVELELINLHKIQEQQTLYTSPEAPHHRVHPLLLISPTFPPLKMKFIALSTFLSIAAASASSVSLVSRRIARPFVLDNQSYSSSLLRFRLCRRANAVSVETKTK